METGMTNLGSGGEAKASLADRDAAETDLAQSGETGGLPTTAGGTMDTAMAADMDPDLIAGTGDASSPRGGAGSITLDDATIGTASPRLGFGQTAAYGETVENTPAPTANEEENDR